jgi:phosphoribosyl 1,2-cyclic phosphodiesterase
MIHHEIISSGSQGNAVIINHNILIDCGVPYKAIAPHAYELKLVLLTHEHADHFNKSTVRRLTAERPTLRFAGGGWMVLKLLEAGVEKKNIDVLEEKHFYVYAGLGVEPVDLFHDVPNCGYKLNLDNEWMFYATDTGSLDDVQAKDYALYLVEANHGEQELRERIASKHAAGEYAYEKRVQHTHLSEEKALEWIYRNIGANGQYVLLHQHREEETNEHEHSDFAGAADAST